MCSQIIKMRGKTGRSGQAARPKAKANLGAKAAASKVAARALNGETAEPPRALREAAKAAAGQQEAAVRVIRGLKAVDSCMRRPSERRTRCWDTFVAAAALALFVTQRTGL